MHKRRPIVCIAVLAFLCSAAQLRADATFRTPNFVVVYAPTAQVAQQFGQMAEQYRKQKAMEWLGQEMPQWPQPCPLYIKPEMGGAGGATTFNYDFRGGYEVTKMTINGAMERMLHSVLPHEMTHTVFAHHFRYPVPRWADEGGSVLSEDDRERAQHDRMCRDFLNQRQAIPLRRLFQLKEYHEVSNVMVLYAEGFSISNYLVNRGGRQAFLGFVAMGMPGNWDQASQNFYQVQSVEILEEAWLNHLKATKNGGNMELTRNTQPAKPGIDGDRLVTRQTSPPSQPLLEPAATVRGQADDDLRWGPVSSGRPSHLPNEMPAAATVPPVRVPPPATRSAASTPSIPPPVRLGLPEFGPAPPIPPPPAACPNCVGGGN